VWVDLLRRHELLTYASAIARTTLVAGVALVLLMLGVLGAIGRKDLWFAHVAPQIRKRVLPDVYAGVDQTVKHIFAASSAGLIVFAALLSIWEVSGSVRGVSGALNRIYETEETRSWKVRFPLSFALSAAIILAIIGAIMLAMAAGGLVHGVAEVPFAVARWLGAVLLIMVGFGLLVRFAPAKPRAKKWASLGAALVVVGWIVQALVFKWYVTSVADFRTATGSLTVVLVLVGFLYVGSIVLLVGIELDELLREDGAEAERTLAHLVRDLFERERL
jgi:YihY family inner membrane protein